MVLSFALVATVVALAVRDEGFHEERVRLNEAGIWVTRRGAVGRFNTEIREIEVNLDGGAGDVAQVDRTVASFAPAGELRMVDPVNQRLAKTPTPLPEGAEVSLGAGVGLVVDAAGGRLWSFDPDRGPPGKLVDKDAIVRTRGKRPIAAAVAQDGTVFFVEKGSTQVGRIPSTGGPRSVAGAIGTGASQPSLTVVGDRVVVLDRADGRLMVAGGGTTQLSRYGRDLVLQQPGPEDRSVLVAGADVLLEVPLDGGPPRLIASQGGGNPVPPVRVGRCAYGAWWADARWTRACEPNGPLATLGVPRAARIVADDGTPMAAGKELRYRVNRGRAVLNDKTDGAIFMVDLPKPVLVTDWGDQRDDSQQDEEETPDKKETCDQAPKVDGTIERGTRPGRPIVVPIASAPEVKASPCDALYVTLAAGQKVPNAEVAVVEDGSAIQVTPSGAPGTTVDVAFAVQGLQGDPVRGLLRVGVRSDNGSLVVTDDSATVAQGETVNVDVLANDRDPEGDPLRLVGLTAPNGATATSRADGTVTFQAGGTSGPVQFTYAAEDDRSARGDGVLTINVVPKGDSKPTPRPDQVEATVGQPVRIDVLRNDTDPDSAHDRLEVKGPPRPKDGATGVTARTVDGEPAMVELVATEDGPPVELVYTVGDGQQVAEGVIKVVRRKPTDEAPVAVRDDVSARAGVPALVDVLANDSDADGDLLAVTSVDLSQAGGVAVEVIDLRVLRVIAPAGFEKQTAVSIPYTVSDGTHPPVRGVVVVAPFESRVANQAPVANPDKASAAVGRWTSVDVLANDIDPEGEQLKVTEAAAPPSGAAARVFVRGNQVRVEPLEGAPRSFDVSYAVVDPGGKSSKAGRITVEVRPGDQNLPPRAGVVVEARALAGQPTTIPIPVLSMDPDGDVVSVHGMGTRLPRLGSVQLPHPGDGGADVVYEAEADLHGPDRFEILVTDGQPGHDPVAVSVRVVVVVPDKAMPPVALPDLLVVRAGAGPQEFDVLANDRPDPDDLEIVGGESAPTVAAEDGRLRLDRGVLTYTPPASIAGASREISFPYHIVDRTGQPGEGLAQVRIVADRPPEPPIAVDDLQPPQLVDSQPLVVDVTANDRDPDDPAKTLEVEIVDPAAHPEAQVLPDGRVRVEIARTSIQFAYRITDRDKGTATAIVTVPVVASLPPTVEPIEVSVAAGDQKAVPVVERARNPSGPPSELRLGPMDPRAVQGGRAVPSGGSVVFTAGTEAGTGGFSYLVENTRTHQATAGRVRVTITGGANRPPRLTLPSSVTLRSGGDPVVLDLSSPKLATDPDRDDTLTFKVLGVSPPTVEADLAGPRLTLTAPKGAGESQATVRLAVSDGTAPDVPGEIVVKILPDPGPEPPRAVPEQVEAKVGEQVEYDVAENDWVPKGQTKRITNVRMLSGGRGTPTQAGDRSVRYTPVEGDRDVRIGYTLQDDYHLDDGSVPPGRSAEGVFEIVVYSRPGRPTKPIATRSSHTVHLSWPRPADNGLDITGYVVRDESGRTWDAPGNQTDISGLENGKAYRFQVAAVNKAYGKADLRDQDYSDLSDPVTPDQVPEQPAPPRVDYPVDRAANNGGQGGVLIVTWERPHVDGSQDVDYIVRSDHGREERTTATSFTFTGLTNGDSYTFTVTAHNAAGDSVTSGSSNAEIPSGVPDAPTNVTVTQEPPEVSDTVAARVTFTPGAENGAATTYKVAPGDVSADPAGTTVPNLPGGQAQSFVITATNRAGSTPSAPVSFTGYGKPDVPTNLRVEEVGDGQVTVAWDPPAKSGGGTLSYTVMVDGAEQPGGDLTFTAKGLTNGQDHSFQVRATNSGGNSGAYSGAVTANPYGVPSVSGLSAGDPGQTSITWTWSVDENGRPTTFDWTLTGVTSGSSTTTSVTTGGLSPNTSYQFCVRPKNTENVRNSGSEVCGTAKTDPLPPDFTLSLSGTVFEKGDKYGKGCGPNECYFVNINYQNFNGTYTYRCYGIAELTFSFPATGTDAYLSQCAARTAQDIGSITIWGPGLPAGGLTR